MDLAESIQNKLDDLSRRFGRDAFGADPIILVGPEEWLSLGEVPYRRFGRESEDMLPGKYAYFYGNTSFEIKPTTTPGVHVKLAERFGGARFGG